tara:strand:- start:6986 stop:7933 length:948 start_codon:yes stop_codon:yes gene_type:complete
MNPYPALRTNDFFKIHVEHLPTKEKIAFEGWVTSFSDTYTSQWQEEMVYGRMDPLATYQRTGRSIQLGFDIPNDSKSHAIDNMANVRQLIKFMYPLYAQGAMAQQNTIQAGPLLGLKWTNLISSANNNGEKLIGYINGGLAYSPEVAEGGFILRGLDPGLGVESQSSIAAKNYFPKKLSLSFTFTVLHTHLVGWSPTAGSIGGRSFTFGGSQGTDNAFPNAFIAPAPPDPEEGSARGSMETADDANENLDPTDDPTPEQEEDKKGAREEAQAQAPDAAADASAVVAADDEEATISIGACHGEHGAQLRDLGMCGD